MHQPQAPRGRERKQGAVPLCMSLRKQPGGLHVTQAGNLRPSGSKGHCVVVTTAFSWDTGLGINTGQKASPSWKTHRYP